MHLSKSFVVAALFWACALTRSSHAFEGDEEPCPAFANQTDGSFPSCDECLSSGCGYAADEGDCVKDCAAVTDTECFSLATSNSTVVADICELASSAGGGGGAGGEAEEEEMCATFEASGETPTCETCLEAGCGWTSDDGDCLKDCAEVNDGAACVSMSGGAGETAAAVCAADVAVEEEEMCAAFETSGETPTCETCVEAGCGWTSDDGDCLKNCAEVNDGAACVSMSGSQTAAAVCGGTGGSTGGTSGASTSASAESIKTVVTLTLAAALLFI